MKYPDTYAGWVRLQRRVARLTQEGLAEKAGLNRTYVNAIENGRIKMPQFGTRQKIHNAFGTTDDELKDAGLLAVDEYGNEYIPEPQAETIEVPAITSNSTDDQRELARTQLHALIDEVVIDGEKAWRVRTLTRMLQDMISEDREG